jgi:Cu+-exporting ATPase
VVLMNSDLRGVVVAIDLGRVIFQRIQLNMLFSLGFNCLGIPIAAGVIYPATQQRLPPEVAGLAMALSSVSVVVSSLLLRRYRPPTVSSSSSGDGGDNGGGGNRSDGGGLSSELTSAADLSDDRALLIEAHGN